MRSSMPFLRDSPSTRSWRKHFSDRRTHGGLDGERKIVWAHAEALAYASLSGRWHPDSPDGQDTQRGTFTSSGSCLARYPERARHYCAHQNLPQCPGVAGALQQPTLRECGSAWALSTATRCTRPGNAGALGGAVWRLCQWRASDHRPVYRQRQGQVGAEPDRCLAAAPRLRRRRPRALVGAAGALFAPVCGR